MKRKLLHFCGFAFLVSCLASCDVLCRYDNFLFERFNKSWTTGFNHETYDEALDFLTYLTTNLEKHQCNDSLTLAAITYKTNITEEKNTAERLLLEADKNANEILEFSVKYPFSPLADSLVLLYQPAVEKYLTEKSNSYKQVADAVEKKVTTKTTFQDAIVLQGQIKYIIGTDSLTTNPEKKNAKRYNSFTKWEQKYTPEKNSQEEIDKLLQEKARLLLLQQTIFKRLIEGNMLLLEKQAQGEAIEKTYQEMSKTFDLQRNYVTIQNVNLLNQDSKRETNHVLVTFEYVIKAKRNIQIFGFVLDHDEQHIQLRVQALINTENQLFVHDAFLTSIQRVL